MKYTRYKAIFCQIYKWTLLIHGHDSQKPPSLITDFIIIHQRGRVNELQIIKIPTIIMMDFHILLACAKTILYSYKLITLSLLLIMKKHYSVTVLRILNELMNVWKRNRIRWISPMIGSFSLMSRENRTNGCIQPKLWNQPYTREIIIQGCRITHLRIFSCI